MWPIYKLWMAAHFSPTAYPIDPSMRVTLSWSYRALQYLSIDTKTMQIGQDLTERQLRLYSQVIQVISLLILSLTVIFSPTFQTCLRQEIHILHCRKSAQVIPC